jgi:hypothetical protein
MKVVYDLTLSGSLYLKVKEFDNGNLTVNGKKVPVDFVLRNGMRMEHRCHR